MSKFYKHDLEQSRLESNELWRLAKAQDKISSKAEHQILHLVKITENGLPDCYEDFDEFLADFYPDFSWATIPSELEIEEVLADSRFQEVVPILKETWGVDMEKNLQEALKETRYNKYKYGV